MCSLAHFSPFPLEEFARLSCPKGLFFSAERKSCTIREHACPAAVAVPVSSLKPSRANRIDTSSNSAMSAAQLFAMHQGLSGICVCNCLQVCKCVKVNNKSTLCRVDLCLVFIDFGVFIVCHGSLCCKPSVAEEAVVRYQDLVG